MDLVDTLKGIAKEHACEVRRKVQLEREAQEMVKQIVDRGFEFTSEVAKWLDMELERLTDLHNPCPMGDNGEEI